LSIPFSMLAVLVAAGALSTVCAQDQAKPEAKSAEKRPKEPLGVSPGFERVDLPVRAFKGGAMVKLGDGRIMIVVGSADVFEPLGSASLVGLFSPDGGKTWGEQRTLVQDAAYNPGRPTLLRTRAGKLWLVYYGFVQAPKKGTTERQSDLWIRASADEGKTWQPARCLFRGYTAGQRGMIETRDGRLVITFSYAVDEGRNVSASLVSADGGATWRQSAGIDLGGAGHHSGALEPAVAELKDGRLWMLIRREKTFWQAFSTDGGLSWGEATPTETTTPLGLGGAPASLIRLASGRLALAWNPRVETPPNPEPWQAIGRSTLAVALSEDDGKTWTKPATCATASMITYPHLLEASPGELLLSTGLLKAKGVKTDVVVFCFSEQTLLRK